MDRIVAGRVKDEEGLAERVTHKRLAGSRIILFLSCLNNRQKRISSSKMSNCIIKLTAILFELSLSFSLSLSCSLSMFISSSPHVSKRENTSFVLCCFYKFRNVI